MSFLYSIANKLGFGNQPKRSFKDFIASFTDLNEQGCGEKVKQYIERMDTLPAIEEWRAEAEAKGENYLKFIIALADLKRTLAQEANPSTKQQLLLVKTQLLLSLGYVFAKEKKNSSGYYDAKELLKRINHDLGDGLGFAQVKFALWTLASITASFAFYFGAKSLYQADNLLQADALNEAKPYAVEGTIIALASLVLGGLAFPRMVNKYSAVKTLSNEPKEKTESRQLAEITASLLKACHKILKQQKALDKVSNKETTQIRQAPSVKPPRAAMIRARYRRNPPPTQSKSWLPGWIWPQQSKKAVQQDIEKCMAADEKDFNAVAAQAKTPKAAGQKKPKQPLPAATSKQASDIKQDVVAGVVKKAESSKVESPVSQLARSSAAPQPPVAPSPINDELRVIQEQLAAMRRRAETAEQELKKQADTAANEVSVLKAQLAEAKDQLQHVSQQLKDYETLPPGWMYAFQGRPEITLGNSKFHWDEKAGRYTKQSIAALTAVSMSGSVLPSSDKPVVEAGSAVAQSGQQPTHASTFTKS